MSTTTTDPNQRFAGVADGATVGDAAQLAAAVRANAPEGNQLDALPKKLSPSRAADFKKCPQKFYYKTLCKISEPASFATLRGTLTHTCCERIFDHPEGERTPELALTYLRPAWEEILNPDLDAIEDDTMRRYAAEGAEAARICVPPGTEEETKLLAAAEECVRKWFQMERVNNFTPRDLTLPDGTQIDGREVHVSASLAGLDIHGFVDRLDRFETADGTVRWSISDYKTSEKVPWLKKAYPERTVARIRHDSFFQLRLYAVAAWYLLGIKVQMLRLVYVGTGDREEGIQVEYVDQAMIDSTIAEIKKIWRDMQNSARTGVWKTDVGPLCQWCYFHDICPAWNADISDIVSECQ